MIIKKVLETSIDLFDPAEIYTHDVEALLVKKLEERYKNRCYQSIYVLRITRIIRRSSIKMKTTRLDGSASLNVQFEVEGEVFIEGHVMHGCKVIEIHTNAITAEHAHAGIKLQKDPSNKISQTLQVGQVIPVVVKRVRYIPNQKEASMIATPYIPNVTDEPVYKINSPISPAETEKLDMFFQQIEEEEKLHVELKKNRKYAFFQDLMYPYKVNMKYDKTHVAETLGMKPIPLQLKDLLKINSGMLIYPSEDNKSNRRVYHSAKSSVPSGLMTVDTSMFPVVANYLNQYLTYLMTLRGFVETYNTDESVKKLITYWKLCKMAKQ